MPQAQPPRRAPFPLRLQKKNSASTAVDETRAGVSSPCRRDACCTPPGSSTPAVLHEIRAGGSSPGRRNACRILPNQNDSGSTTAPVDEIGAAGRRPPQPLPPGRLLHPPLAAKRWHQHGQHGQRWGARQHPLLPERVAPTPGPAKHGQQSGRRGLYRAGRQQALPPQCCTPPPQTAKQGHQHGRHGEIRGGRQPPLRS